MVPISWSVANTGKSCSFSTTYPDLGDGITDEWRASSGGPNGITFFSGKKVWAGPGNYTFTCTITDGGTYSDSVTLIVNDCAPPTVWNSTTHTCDNPNALRICPSSLSLPVGGTPYGMTAWYLLSGVDCDNTGPATEVTDQVTWSSGTPSVATINANTGTLTTGNFGTTAISISSYLSRTATPASVNTLANVAICPTSGTVEVGGEIQFAAYFRASSPINCSNLSNTIDITTRVIWSTADTSVATADRGTVRGVGPGRTRVTVTDYYGRLSANNPEVTVTAPPVQALRICPSSISLPGSGEVYTMRAWYLLSGVDCGDPGPALDVTKSVTWTSGTPSVASIEANGANAGRLTTANRGTTSVSISSYMGQTATPATVNVLGYTAVCPVTATTYVGNTASLRAYYHNGLSVNCGDLSGTTDVTAGATWTTSNAGVATVSTGTVTGVSIGSASIDIANYRGTDASPATVTVLATPPNVLRICPSSISLPGSGEVYTMRAWYLLSGVDCGDPGPALDVTKSVTWTSGTPSVASIEANGANAGRLTTANRGTTSVSISSYMGQVATPATVTVLGDYKICPASAVVGRFGYQFSSYYDPDSTVDCGSLGGTTNVTGSVTWSSARPSVATVGNGSSAGLVMPVSVGSSNITTTAYAGIPSNVARADVTCIPTNTCASPSSRDRAANVCPNETFNIDDGCGYAITCTGTRICDFNWKEVGQ